MEYLNIPTQFTIFGRTVNVSFSDRIVQASDALGRAEFANDTITLQPSCAGYERSVAQVEQTFYHEMVHFILHAMNHRLKDDESFVDTFASVLHQAILSFKFNNKKK